MSNLSTDFAPNSLLDSESKSSRSANGPFNKKLRTVFFLRKITVIPKSLASQVGHFLSKKFYPKKQKTHGYSFWWFFTKPFEKYASVKLDHFPRFPVANSKKVFELPPSRYILRPTELPGNYGVLNR